MIETGLPTRRRRGGHFSYGPHRLQRGVCGSTDGGPALPNRRSKTNALGKDFPVTGLDPTPFEDRLPSQGCVEVNSGSPLDFTPCRGKPFGKISRRGLIQKHPQTGRRVEPFQHVSNPL
jgi:hypothetical protein